MVALTYLFFYCISSIPLWFSFIPLALAIIAYVVFKKQRAIRNTFVVACLLVTILLLVLHLYTLSVGGNGRSRLNAHFDGIINPDCVVRHRFRMLGFGDTDDFWKLKYIDTNDCQQVIQKFDLKPTDRDHPSSLTSRPRWWPKSVGSYSVYQGDDIYGSRIEFWIPKEDSNFYLFKFSE
jgi:hypothetical protein